MKEAESRKLIAIVEDDPGVARIIEQVLDDFSFHTVWCRSAGDLLRRLRTLQPDLCIIDLGLPDMDGIETMSALRSIDHKVKVVLSSGYGESSVRRRLVGEEPTHFLQKPFVEDELRQALESAIGSETRRSS